MRTRASDTRPLGEGLAVVRAVLLIGINGRERDRDVGLRCVYFCSVIIPGLWALHMTTLDQQPVTLSFYLSKVTISGHDLGNKVGTLN